MEGRSLSPRVVSELLERFKRQKVMISRAIKTTFPFLEGLRDNNLITNKMYENFQDSCRSLVPVQNVIYRALDELEKIFDVQVLHELFSVVNLENYPDLELIRGSFENVLPDGFFFYRRNGGDPNSQLRLEQGPSGSISQRSLTWSPLDPSSSEGQRSNDRRNSNLIQGNQTENYQLSRSPNHLVLSLPEDGVSEDLGENVLISRVRRDASSNAGNNTNEPERTPEILPRGPASVPEDSCELQAQLNNRDATPESRSLLPPNEERAVRLDNEFQISPCSVALVDIKKENPSFSLHGNQQTRARIIQNEDSEVIELHSDDSDGGENFSEASTSAASQPAPAYSRQPPTRRTHRRGELRSDDANGGENFSEASTLVPSQPAPAYSRQPPTQRPYIRQELRSADADGEENFSEASTSAASQPAPAYSRQPPTQRPYIKRELRSADADGGENFSEASTSGASQPAPAYSRQPSSQRPYIKRELRSADADGGENFSEASTSAVSQPAPSYSRQPPTKRPCIRRELRSADADGGENFSEASTSATSQPAPAYSRQPHTQRAYIRRELRSADADGGENFSEASTSAASQPAPAYYRQPSSQRPYIKRELRSADADGGENFSEASTSAASQPAPAYSRQPPTQRPYLRGDFLARWINPSSQQGRRRAKKCPRIPRDDNVDFGGAELPVKCGNVEGILYKEKLKQGIYERSIRSQTGRWLTPMEFEIEGNRERSKNWRQSIRCGGRTLGELIKRGVLQDAPRKKKETPPRPWQRKRKLGNPKTCKVCRKPRKVYPCATCRKFYHKNCHIPPVEDTSPWHCTFCKRKDQLRCQNTQECHKEAEVLKRKMTPEEQLKCELLLLIIYCYPKSGFFIQKPKQRKTNFPDLREHMWLNKIKTCLNKKEYRLVQHFVEDMRLIFQNHSMFYKRRFKNLGIRVGNRFETTFKRIFSIEDTSKQHPPCSTVLLT